MVKEYSNPYNNAVTSQNLIGIYHVILFTSIILVKETGYAFVTLLFNECMWCNSIEERVKTNIKTNEYLNLYIIYAIKYDFNTPYYIIK